MAVLVGSNCSRLAQACANGAAAKRIGNVIPPGKLPAHANTMAMSLAMLTCSAPMVVKGRDGLTRAAAVKMVGIIISLPSPV